MNSPALSSVTCTCTMKFSARVSIFLLGLGFICFRIWVRKWTPFQRTVTDMQRGAQKVMKVTSITTDTFLHVQQLRKTNLRNFCRQFRELNNLNASETADQLLSTLAVSPKLLMVYCKPSDLVLDDWEETVHLLEDRADTTLRSALADKGQPWSLGDYNASSLKIVLQTFTKVLFVRDPFERLVSRYMDGRAGEVTFDEFIDDVLVDEVGEDGLSFDSTVALCHPCFVRYDYVVRYDFSKAELYHVVRRLGLPRKLRPSRPLRGKSKLTWRWLSENLFGGLSGRQVNQLSTAYWCDLVAFALRSSRLWNGSFVTAG